VDEIEFTLDGERFRLTRDRVLLAMREQIPGRIQTYAVEIEGTRYPVKQVLAQALRIPTRRFITTRAQDILKKLDFQVIDMELDGVAGNDEPGQAPRSVECLRLAVALLASKPSATSAEVIIVAEDFSTWLATA
jgi:hypothetical protein